jgi:D-alanyl-D-alanine carboxypeptidase
MLLAAVVFAVVSELVAGADTGADIRLQRMEERIDTQENTINELRHKLEDLEEQVRNRPARDPVVANVNPNFGGGLGEESEQPSTEGLTDEMILAAEHFNRKVQRPRASFMLDMLGHPRDSYTQECQGVTNIRLKDAMETRTIGPITVTMLKPALDSLEKVMARLAAEEPEIYASIGTAGALCARYVRGSNSSVSSHAWGAAVDLTIGGVLDNFANEKTQFALILVAEAFNDEGWYWGAGYGREDSMHFEVGEDLVTQWVTAGML